MLKYLYDVFFSSQLDSYPSFLEFNFTEYGHHHVFGGPLGNGYVADDFMIYSCFLILNHILPSLTSQNTDSSMSLVDFSEISMSQMAQRVFLFLADNHILLSLILTSQNKKNHHAFGEPLLNANVTDGLACVFLFLATIMSLSLFSSYS